LNAFLLQIATFYCEFMEGLGASSTLAPPLIITDKHRRFYKVQDYSAVPPRRSVTKLALFATKAYLTTDR